MMMLIAAAHALATLVAADLHLSVYGNTALAGRPLVNRTIATISKLGLQPFSSAVLVGQIRVCLLYTSPSPRD